MPLNRPFLVPLNGPLPDDGSLPDEALLSVLAAPILEWMTRAGRSTPLRGVVPADRLSPDLLIRAMPNYFSFARPYPVTLAEFSANVSDLLGPRGPQGTLPQPQVPPSVADFLRGLGESFPSAVIPPGYLSEDRPSGRTLGELLRPSPFLPQPLPQPLSQSLAPNFTFSPPGGGME